MLHEVRAALLEEAQRSPSLLSDLAGLEQYVAESYDARSFVELLQNADDAGATRFVIQRSGDFLLVANDGRPFTKIDFESLCRSAASSKSRGTSIGYRGIGFKSVVSLAKTIHLVTGSLATTFSRERTSAIVPQASRVPLIRIPHALEAAELAKFSTALHGLLSEGLNTVFVFENLFADRIENEYSSFDATALLFLRNVASIELRATKALAITARREVDDTSSRSIVLTDANGTVAWRLHEQNGFSIAFKYIEKKIARLPEIEAVAHAFLPTLEPTGLGVKIHGDISTDPSRTRVVFDDRTNDGIKSIAELVVGLLEKILATPVSVESAAMLNALLPLTDPRMAAFQRRTFKTELMAAFQRAAGKRFENLRFRPTWLNSTDFNVLAKKSGLRTVPALLEDAEGVRSFLGFLGGKETKLDEISNSLGEAKLTVQGATEVVTLLGQLNATKQISAETYVKPEWALWPIQGKVLSFAEAIATTAPLDRTPIDLLIEKSGAREAHRLIATMSDQKTADALLPEELIAPAKKSEAHYVPETTGVLLEVTAAKQQLSLKKWRSAEQQVLNLLESLGWKVEDVSRQNVGYDLEAKNPDGKPVFIEVKSIDYPTQPFTLTSNEEAVARQKGDQYQLAIVRLNENFLEVVFIQDPARYLKLTRQCRQWVWECADYKFNPQRVRLE